MFVTLGKALRAQQLYEENNPVYQRFVSQLAEAVGGLWGEMDRLQISVEEDNFSWMGEEVYKGASRADSLAFLLFKDGIREFTLLEGLEGDELPILLEVLNRARDLRPEGDDLLTVLWEKDLKFFTYLFVELHADGVDLPEAGEGHDGDFTAVMEEEIGEEATEDDDQGADEASAGPAPVSTDDFNPTLYSLTPQEMAQMREELQLEMDRDLRGDVITALFDRVEEPRFPDRQKEILEIFRTLLPNFLSRGALSSAGDILDEGQRLRVEALGADLAKATARLALPT